MMKTEVIGRDKERRLALEECERKIVMQFRKGIDASCAIAKEFRVIEEQELYRDLGYETFNAYIEQRLGLEMQAVRKARAVLLTYETLKKAGMELPENESQVIELARVEPEQQPLVWQLVLEAAGKIDKRVTAAAVRDAVKQYEEGKRNSDETGTRRGVKTSLDLDEPEPAATNGAPKKMTPVVKKIELYEEGEAALERIKRLCGEPIAKGILAGNLPMTERDLIKWSDQTDEMVKTLAHYVHDLRWPVSRALTFEQRTLNEATTLGELIMLAMARGGRYVEATDIYKLTLQMAAAA